jgi:hypothetical protein
MAADCPPAASLALRAKQSVAERHSSIQRKKSKRPNRVHATSDRKITERSERRKPVGCSNDDVINEFDFEKLSGSEEIASGRDVCG